MGDLVLIIHFYIIKIKILTCKIISFTSIVVKTLEELVHRAVMSALEKQGLLSNHQHRLRARNYTVSLLSETIHDWAFALEQRNSVHSLFLDLVKIFDFVSHHQLLLILRTGFDIFLILVTNREKLLMVKRQIGSL